MADSHSGNKKKRSRNNYEQSEEHVARKRSCHIDQVCIIHCTNDESSDLTSLKDFQSWKTLLQAAEIRKFHPILELAQSLKGEEFPDILYHRSCRSIFTMKRDLDKIRNEHEKNADLSVAKERRSSIRQVSTDSTTYDRICIFCNKVSKYAKGKDTREQLIQCCDLRADETIRNAALAKKDSEILSKVSRELVAAEGCYHRSCYREYTRPLSSSSTATTTNLKQEDPYVKLESIAYDKLFKYIRSSILEQPKLVRLNELTQMLVKFMKELGIPEIKESTKTHIRRKLAAEFGNLLEFENLLDSNQLYVIPQTLTRLHLAKEVAFLSQQQQSFSEVNDIEDIKRVALSLRDAIRNNKSDLEWPPQPSQLTESNVNLPENVKVFLSTLLTGSNNEAQEEPKTLKVQRLINSFGQDMVFGVTAGRQKTPKHILLPYAVKSLTNNVEVIQMLNRCGHGVAYSQIEELNTALCIQKMAMTPENAIPLPKNIQPYYNTSLAWDNIDRTEETLSGGGTSHRVNGIAIQAPYFGPHLTSSIPVPTIVKTKQRSVNLVSDHELPVYNAGERCGPRARSYVKVTSEEIELNVLKKNMLWILARLHAAERQRIAGWTGFNISVRNEVVNQDNIGYLPTINAPATNLSTVYEVLDQSLKIKASLKLKSIVVVFDQALYAKATEIKWKHSVKFNDVILRMGTFHTMCVLLAVIGKRFQDAGLKDICIESGVIAEGSVPGVLEGRRYNRALRFHKLMYEALRRTTWWGFLPWLQEHHSDDKVMVDRSFNDLQSLSENPSEEEFQKKLTSKSFSRLVELYRMYMDFLRNKNGKLSQFWITYLDIVEILLGLLRASREGDWKLHLLCIRNMIPWCFAYDHLNYARYLSAYLSEMSHLKDEHPDVLEYMESGGFAVQIGAGNPFGKIPVDQACEETINKDTQTPGGTKGFSLKPRAVSKYYLVAEYRSIFMKNLKEMLHLTNSSNQHTDLQKSRITKDEADVKLLIATLDNWISPFQSDQQELVCLSTGKVATKEIQNDLLNAKDIGETAYLTFSKQRIETAPAPTKTSFHAKMTKVKLTTFTNLNKKMKIKRGDKSIMLKADRALFAQMILIAETRELSMKSVLSHPLGPLPWSLASADGSLKKTTKSTLAKELQKNVPATEAFQQPSACLIDGMAMVQKLKGDHKTFAEVADGLMAMVLREGMTSDRIDIVFDVYRETSIKNMERENRGSETGNEFRMNIQAEHKVMQWRKFLSNPNNKKQLVVFLSKEWQKERFRQRLARKTLYITVEDTCLEVLPNGITTLKEDLKSTHEEADTRLLFHASHAARNGYSSIVICSEDTDVFLLCLAFKTLIPSTMYLKCGSQNRTKYINITTVVQLHGSNVCKCLLGLHAFTGCDTTSAFSGKGKLGALKLVKTNQPFCEMFQQLGTEWQLNNELFLRLQEFICTLYSANSKTKSVNELRYRLFCARKGNLESSQLPPCSDTLRKHCERANYQTAIWRRSLESCPQVPSPVGHGWYCENGELIIDWMSGDPAPKAVLELLSCQCKKSCQLPSCVCLSNGLKCTELCKLQECGNWREEPTDVNDEDDDDD